VSAPFETLSPALRLGEGAPQQLAQDGEAVQRTGKAAAAPRTRTRLRGAKAAARRRLFVHVTRLLGFL
jgi:hypothetical protein